MSRGAAGPARLVVTGGPYPRPMTRTKTVHRCQECGAAFARWAGRCTACGAWNTLVEEREPAPGSGRPRAAGVDRPAGAVPLASVDASCADPRPTGVDELDRVLGGGLVPGSVTLVAGEPGIGKSTLLLQALAASAAAGNRVLLVSGEESAQQVRLRAERLGALHDGVYVLAETELPSVVAAIEHTGASLVVVDSIQTLVHTDLDSAPGSVAQVRESASRLVRLAKQLGTAVVLVGHVTKEGSIAGPRVLEHVVDTVVAFEGDRHHSLRLLRAVKHRFGPTGDLGVFEMTGDGLAAVPDASALLLEDRAVGDAGSVVLPALEGRRPLLVEIQALAAETKMATPRRSAQGVDAGRLALLLAVLEKRLGVAFFDCEVFASAVGGVRVAEPAADLAVALALVSARTGVPIRPDVVACGEVGLGGEVRQVADAGRRLAEAARFGFGRAIVPASCPVEVAGAAGLTVHRVASLREAVQAAGLATARSPRPPAGSGAGSMSACRPAAALR